MSRTLAHHAVVLAVLFSGAAVALNAQEHCSLFQPDAGCRSATAPALRVSFGRAELPATPWVYVPSRSHAQQGERLLFRPAQLQATVRQKPTAPIDCRMLQPADPLVDPGMVHRTHSGVAHTMRVLTVEPCKVVNRHR